MALLGAACTSASPQAPAATTSPTVAGATASPSVTPAPVAATGTASPTATPTAEDACAAAPIDPPERGSQLAERCDSVAIPAGGRVQIDGNAIVRESGAVPPPCAAFVLVLSWLVEAPDPATPPPDIEVTTVQQGVAATVGDGPDGIAPGYCGVATLENRGDRDVSVVVRILLADLS